MMRENGLRALHGYRTRHIPVTKPQALIPNLLQRQFTVSRPNEVWATDITYIRTWQDWLYLAVVLDFFSRRVVSLGKLTALGDYQPSSTSRRGACIDFAVTNCPGTHVFCQLIYQFFESNFG